MSMKVKPKTVSGPWKKGATLDVHTISSEYTGKNEAGYDTWDTKRSPIGEVLYLLKYKNDKGQAKILGKGVAWYADKYWSAEMDAIVTMPPSAKFRAYQPVVEIAKRASAIMEIPCLDGLVHKETDESLKDLNSKAEKLEVLDGTLSLDPRIKIRRKTLLLVDDLYATGATAESVTNLLLDAGAKAVYFIAITRKRSV